MVIPPGRNNGEARTAEEGDGLRPTVSLRSRAWRPPGRILLRLANALRRPHGFRLVRRQDGFARSEPLGRVEPDTAGFRPPGESSIEFASSARGSALSSCAPTPVSSQVPTRTSERLVPGLPCLALEPAFDLCTVRALRRVQWEVLKLARGDDEPRPGRIVGHRPDTRRARTCRRTSPGSSPCLRL